MNSRTAILFLIILVSTFTLVFSVDSVDVDYSTDGTQKNVTDFFFLAEKDNFVCKDNKRFPPTNGLQQRDGSCSDTVQGEIPDVDHMVSSLIIEPENGEVIAANKSFTIKVSTINLISGFFDDPATQYYTFPQVVDIKTGKIFGHSHITIQQLKSVTDAPNPQLFAFFKGLNNPEVDDVFIQSVDNGLPPGLFRICTMVASFAHQPTIMPVAQRGAQDDCIRIKVVEKKDDKKRRRNIMNKKKST